VTRSLRANVVGLPHHLVHRGNNRQPIFYESSDYIRYMSFLSYASNRFGCDVHAYVLMTNHVHLLVTQRAPNGIARLMQVVAGRYAVYLNRARARTGTVWEGRYHGSPIETDRHFFTCHRYIELNPVRAGIVGDVAAYRWSSYDYNALGQDDACVTPHDLYLSLGRDKDARCRGYRALFSENLCEELLAEIRIAVHQNRPLGGASGSEQGEASLTLL
jgi:putative transposase